MFRIHFRLKSGPKQYIQVIQQVMEPRNPWTNVTVTPLKTEKEITQSNFVALNNGYYINSKLEEADDNAMFNIAISSHYDIAYVQSLLDNKAILIQLQEAKVVRKCDQKKQQVELSSMGAAKSLQFASNLQEYRALQRLRLERGLSYRKLLSRFCLDYDEREELKKVCSEFDGKPFAVYCLQIHDTEDTLRLDKIVNSRDFLRIRGLDIVQQAIKMTQSKIIQEFVTTYNYFEESFLVVQKAIRKLKEALFQQSETVNPSEPMKLHKQLIVWDKGTLKFAKCEMQVVQRNPLMCILVVKPQTILQTRIPSQKYKHINSQNSESETKLSPPSQMSRTASFREANLPRHSIQIVSRVFPN